MTMAHFSDLDSDIVNAISETKSDKQNQEENAASQASSLFDVALPSSDHPYLVSKGIKGYGIRQKDSNLLIPLRDSTGTLHSLQAITPDGHTQFLPDGKVKGCFHAIAGKQDVLLICESYATGASLREATGYAVAVTFSAENLEIVARDLRLLLPEIGIVIAANDDRHTEGSPALLKAQATAASVKGVVAIPEFGIKRPAKAIDFNDLHKQMGLDLVKQCVETAVASLPNNVNSPAPIFEAVETVDNHRNVPRPDPMCLYGLVGDIANAGSHRTEANTYAVAASALAYLSAALGRKAYIPIGDNLNHTRLFFIHVGRSGIGRKGTSKGLIKIIDKALRNRDETLAPNIHTGGLSTREGLAMLIHDGYKDGKIVIPPIVDKRLFVMESEFANVLQQNKRDGNTLSAALRDAWDGTSIKPAVKNNPVTTTDPHIAIIGDVTPSELRSLMEKRDLSNGFANRFIFFWAEGEKVIALPPPTPSSVVDALTDRVAQVLQYIGADQHGENDVIQMELAPDARSFYEHTYLNELQDRSAGERISGLLERRAPMLLRLAMLFALTDQTTNIEVHHINAALAWIRFWADSVKFIFQSADDEAETAHISDVAKRIATYLYDHGQSTRTDLSKKCFGGHISKIAIDTALDELLTAAPPVIEVESVPRPQGQSGSPTKFYKLCTQTATANCAKPAKCQPGSELEVYNEEIRSGQIKVNNSLNSHTSQPHI
jgi:hypothetical protein